MLLADDEFLLKRPSVNLNIYNQFLRNSKIKYGKRSVLSEK